MEVPAKYYFPFYVIRYYHYGDYVTKIPTNSTEFAWVKVLLVVSVRSSVQRLHSASFVTRNLKFSPRNSQ